MSKPIPKANVCKKRCHNREVAIAAVFFLTPSVVMLSIWFVWPMIQSFLISFQDYNYMFRERAVFVGLGNYIILFNDPEFYKALIHSLLFVAITVPIQTSFSLLLAVLVNSSIKGRGFLRTAYYTPYVLSAVAVTTVFMYFFVKGGVMSSFFALFGMANVTWYANVGLAMPFIGILYIWQTIGFYMIYYLSGLQTIPGELYEAAQIDGANKVQSFFRITVPNLKSTTFLVMTYSIIQAFQLYDQIAVTTASNGGLGSPAGATSTLLTYFYTHSFKFYRMGYGSAVAVVLFAIILTVSIIQRKISKVED